MKTVIEMARESNLMDSRDDWGSVPIEYEVAINAFAELVRADEREQGQKWFDAVTAQHKQAILAEREACAKVCENEWSNLAESKYGEECADAIRARSNT